MTPMPAAEVRRRGTRIRRRNNAIAAVGGLAVVAAIAAPLAVFADNQPSSEPPVATPVEWVQEIPADFPLDDGLGTAGDPAHVGTESGESVFDAIAICEQEVWSPERPASTDVLGAAWSGDLEGGDQRTLALYPDADTAQSALDDMRDAVSSCPEPTGRGDAIVPVQLDASTGDDALAYMDQYWSGGGPDGQGNAYVMTRVGNALLLDRTYFGGAGSMEIAQQTVDLLTDRSAGVVAAMCVFSETGCGTSGAEAEDTSGSAATSIPDGFELMAGLPTEGVPQNSGEDLADIDLTACDRAPAAPNTVDDLRGDFRQPEGIRERQLMLFASEDSAESWMTDTSGAFVDCQVPVQEGVVGEYRELGSDLGESARTITLTFQVDGEPGPGHEIIEFVRVGTAVLVATTRIDTDSEPVTEEALADFVATSQAEVNPVVDAMCVFADDDRC